MIRARSRKLRNKFKTGFFRIQNLLSSHALELGLRFSCSPLVAIGWRLAMRASCKVQAKSYGREKVVVLSKSGGIEDIEAAYAQSKAKYNVLFLPREVIKQSGIHWLHDYVTDNFYHSEDPKVEAAKMAYRQHLKSVLIWFKRLFGISVIVQFNVVFWAERELAAACADIGVRFVAAHKECMWSSLSLASQRAFYSRVVGSFPGHGVSVYSSTFKDVFVESGLVEKTAVFVTGCARLDESHQLRVSNHPGKKKVVLFYLIQSSAGLPKLMYNDSADLLRGPDLRDGSVGDWSETADKVNKAVMSLAITNPDIHFICKGKTGFADHQLTQLKDAAGGGSLPNNVELIAGGIGHKLLEKASVVIGFNTTAVLEAMAAGVPVIVPNIFSEQEKQIAGYAHEVNEGALVPTTTDQLKSMVLDVLEAGHRYKELTQGQKNVLDRLLGNSDGKAGARLRAFLDKAVYNEL